MFGKDLGVKSLFEILSLLVHFNVKVVATRGSLLGVELLESYRDLDVLAGDMIINLRSWF